jgi:hypothetical protein
MSATGALAIAVALAGCGTTTYFAGRTLPPSGLVNRVLIAIQNPSSLTKGGLQFVDANYDVRFNYDSKIGSFSISGYSGALPISIQNMPEEQAGAIYGSGDGSFAVVNYAKESGGAAMFTAFSSSIYITRSESYIFAATQASPRTLTVVDKTGSGATVGLGLPGIYRVSVNPGGSVALAFVQNSNYVYYPRKLSATQTIAYSGGPSTWPKGATDCEPFNAPTWCLFQAQSPDGTPLNFDRPVKAIFSADGGTAYVLSCGPECGGSKSSVTPIPTAPLIFLTGQQSGNLPTTAALASSTINVPGGASNALLDSSTLYVVGQQKMPDGLFGGHLTVVTLPTNTTAASVSAPISISDGAPGAVSRMILADDNTLWIGMTKCTSGERYNNNDAYGCLTMVNTSTNTVDLLEPFLGDLTGIAAVTGKHKIYVAQGGQVYIYKTTDGSSIDNQYVTVTGTAWDVAYMDGITDSNNTVY